MNKAEAMNMEFYSHSKRVIRTGIVIGFIFFIGSLYARLVDVRAIGSGDLMLSGEFGEQVVNSVGSSDCQPVEMSR